MKKKHKREIKKAIQDVLVRYIYMDVYWHNKVSDAICTMLVEKGINFGIPEDIPSYELPRKLTKDKVNEFCNFKAKADDQPELCPDEGYSWGEPLEMICDLAQGYDGFDSVESLRELIDEIRGIAERGLKKKEPRQ